MREVKDSHDSWIGYIPKTWGTKRIKEFLAERKETCTSNDNYDLLAVSEYYGVARKSDVISDNEFITHAESLEGYKVCHPDDLIMNIMLAWKRAMGVSNYTGITSPAYCVFSPKEDVSMQYFHHLFRTDFYASLFKQYSTGIIDSRLRLYPDKFLALRCHFPPVEEQQRIADFLYRKCACIENVLEKTRKSIEGYKKLKQSIITRAVTNGIREKNDTKPSGVEWIGSMPRNWTRGKLKSFSSIISKGATPKDISTEQDSTHQVRFLKSENIVANHLVDKPQFYIGEDIHCGELKRSQLSSNDILFVIAGASLGKVAMMDESLLEANTNQAMSFIRVKNEYLPMKKYIWYSLQTNLVKTYIQLFSVQSAQPNISMEDLGNYFILYPQDSHEIEEITTFLDHECAEINSLIASKEKFITELESYKKSLIYEYVTGKKEVPNTI